jgi:hypothetical protein
MLHSRHPRLGLADRKVLDVSMEDIGAGPDFGSIRSYLGDVKGKRVIEITCDDEYSPWVLSGRGTGDCETAIRVPVKAVYLHLDNGRTLTFYAIEDQLGFRYDGDT